MARRSRQVQRRRRRGDEPISSIKCAGECKLQVTNVVKWGATAWKEGPHTDPGPTPKGGDLKKAAEALAEEVKRWAKPVPLEPKCKKEDGCICEETDEIDWDKKKLHKRTWEDPFVSDGHNFIVYFVVEFKLAIVPGACTEAGPTIQGKYY
jgi:hypothetical protein